ncbi:MAG TPA: GGDEF domain-containing protein [Capillimicrobium sp.]|nr:GGDEF domain-containing protein [Capillimicrobium sp.]
MAGARPPFPDPIDARYRRHAKLIGVAVTLAVALYVAVYAAWTWERPDRTALLVLAGTGALASLALLNVKTRTPPAGRGRAVLALTWTAVGLGFITALVALDGGPAESPLAATYVLPLLFATLAFPPVAILISGVAVVATFAVASVAAGATGADTFAYVSALATAAALCWALSRVHHRQRDEFARLSRSDPLTGCLNRRGLEERLSAELARAERRGHPVSLVILDLDRFKDVNDREGHAAGDARLRWTVECLTACIRPSDALGRLGGDEFAVVLPETAAARAEAVAARLARALSEKSPASVGVATFPDDADGAERLQARADERLYAAKARR